jgi:hypothetical protein
MGSLLKEVMREGYYNPDSELIPELMLLGELDHVELPLNSGKLIAMDVIRYNKRNYVMKVQDKGKWFGSFDEIRLSIL